MRFLKARQGSALVAAMVIGSLALGAILAFSQLLRSGTRQYAANWQRIVAAESARSAFVLMEAALRRRLYEVPPEDRMGRTKCLRRFDFGLSGNTPEGAEFTVNAVLEPTTMILTMDSTSTFQRASVSLQKRLKINDASKYLAFSKNSGISIIRSNYGNSEPTALIAGDRRIYFEGPVELVPNNITNRPSAPNFSSPQALPNPYLAAQGIFQAERMLFLKGISYQSIMVREPNTGEIPYASLSPYATAGIYSAQPGDGAFLFTPDEALARNIFSTVAAEASTGPLSRSDLFQQFLPKVLFTRDTIGGTSYPLRSSAGIDDRTYIRNADRWMHWKFRYGGAALFGTQGDYTCLGPNTPPYKSCSSSEVFPKGFKNWRRDAGLDEVLITTDGDAIQFPEPDWDNLQSLEEDAAYCGIVVDESNTTPLTGPPLEDCDTSDYNAMRRYANNPTTNPCDQVRSLAIENLSSLLNNFSASAYNDNANRQNYLRRVIYHKVPMRISQTRPQGIWTNFTNRKNLPLWIVGEAPLILQPHQPDTTSPLDDPPGNVKRRALYFNEPVNRTASSPSSLPIMTMNPDQVHVWSPFHQSVDFNELKTDFPVVSGKIKPTYHIMTDYKHHENDGFKYGLRRLLISNVGIIGSINASAYDRGFLLRGMWGAMNGDISQFVNSQCMFDRPGDGVGTSELSTSMPAYNVPWIPPPGSRFYKPAADTRSIHIAPNYVPWVFTLQNLEGLGQETVIEFRGARVHIPFSSAVIAGKRRLNVPLKVGSSMLSTIIDTSDRQFIWNASHYFPLYPSPGTPCTSISSLSLTFNISAYQYYDSPLFSQSNGDADLTSIGSIGATELPAVQLGN